MIIIIIIYLFAMNDMSIKMTNYNHKKENRKKNKEKMSFLLILI